VRMCVDTRESEQRGAPTLLQYWEMDIALMGTDCTADRGAPVVWRPPQSSRRPHAPPIISCSDPPIASVARTGRTVSCGALLRRPGLRAIYAAAVPDDARRHGAVRTSARPVRWSLTRRQAGPVPRHLRLCANDNDACACPGA
jgi:hypothetical protein